MKGLRKHKTYATTQGTFLIGAVPILSWIQKMPTCTDSS